MKSSWLLALSCVFLVNSAWGQQPAAATRAHSIVQTPNSAASHADPTVPNSPEVWLYTQEMRRYEDPIQAVRRKAEAQAAQRMERMAAMKWYGFSNSRPVASPVPSMEFYSPSWTGGANHPYHWSGVAHAPRAVYVLPSTIR